MQECVDILCVNQILVSWLSSLPTPHWCLLW